MIKGKANIVLDGQWGSTGKGKLIGYLALAHDVSLATCDFMSNAGHTFVDDDGKKYVSCQVPTSFVNTDCELAINAGGAVTIDRLLKEIEEFDVADRLTIHPHCAVITEEDRDHEAKVLARISSTLKGCGGSLSRKVMRVAKLAKDEPKLKQWIGDTTALTQKHLSIGGTVLVEGAQGFDLSLNHGHEYPFVTSRDVTTMSILNNACIPPLWLGDVYGCLRTYPIRVGNMFDGEGNQIGHSGPWYDDHEEIDWDKLKATSGSDIDLTERTTVTNKVRRLFTFSHYQVRKFIRACAPTKLFVNFVNHLCAADVGKTELDDLSVETRIWLNELQETVGDEWISDVKYKPEISHLGTGAKNGDMVVL